MSNKFIISSDNTCDLSKELILKHDVKIINVGITLGDKFYDGVTDELDSLTVLEYAERTGVLPKTSAISVDEYTDYFKKLTANGDGVIHFCISSGSSSCYDHAMMAAKEFENVLVVDSKQLSSGQGLLVMKAIDYRDEGMGLQECFDKIESIKHKARTSFVLDRLDFLHKGGRCSLLSLIGAKILKIHPHIAMNDGALKMKKKYPGKLLRCVEQYVADLAQEYTDYEKRRVFITHCAASDDIVEAVKAKVLELFDFEEILFTTAGATVSSHCGRNTIGVLFIAE